MSLLILGGTSDALRLAKQLLHYGLDITYSIAGLTGTTRQPEIDCPVLIGGIQANGGWPALLSDGQFVAVIDATHPYATNISRQAKSACAQHGVAYFGYCRPPWQPQEGDNWIECDDWQSIVDQLKRFERPFVTLGLLDKQQLEQLPNPTFLRSASLPSFAMPLHCQWLAQIGPFQLEQERALLKEQNIDVLVCKNSGGEMVQNKLIAARELGLPVLMLARPNETAGFACISKLANELIYLYGIQSKEAGLTNV